MSRFCLPRDIYHGKGCLEELKNLKGMYFADNKLKNLSGIQNLKKLEDVDVSNNKLTQLPSMKKLKNSIQNSQVLPEINLVKKS